MKISQQQKNLLIGVLENTIESLDMSDNVEFGDDLRHLLSEAKQIKKLKEAVP